MTSRALAFSLVCFVAAPLRAEIPAQEKKEAAALIQELPGQTMIRQYDQMTRPGDEEKGSAEEKKLAADQLAKVREIVPKLRKLIKPGASIFDYPGLLSHGPSVYNPPIDEDTPENYQLYVGYNPAHIQGVFPYDFKVEFNSKGVIVTVKDVVWKQ